MRRKAGEIGHNAHRHIMAGYYGTRNWSHTERQGSGGRRGIEESPHSTRRKRIGEGE